MNRRSFAIFLPLLLTGASYLKSQPPDAAGRKIYESKCVRCHGKKGTRGFLGAKNLLLSRLNDNELYATISDGKQIMPSWKEKLAPEQILQVVRYVKSLRSTGNQ